MAHSRNGKAGGYEGGVWFVRRGLAPVVERVAMSKRQEKR